MDVSDNRMPTVMVIILWGIEKRPFEYWKHLNTELFEIRISNGSVVVVEIFIIKTLKHWAFIMKIVKRIMYVQ